MKRKGTKPRAGFEPAYSCSAGNRVRPDSATLAQFRIAEWGV
jgi:hypothetical protein